MQNQICVKNIYQKYTTEIDISFTFLMARTASTTMFVRASARPGCTLVPREVLKNIVNFLNISKLKLCV